MMYSYWLTLCNSPHIFTIYSQTKVPIKLRDIVLPQHWVIIQLLILRTAMRHIDRKAHFKIKSVLKHLIYEALCFLCATLFSDLVLIILVNAHSKILSVKLTLLSVYIIQTLRPCLHKARPVFIKILRILSENS